ncbi:Clp protease N-terminal domain-containing protein [Streptomyces sp. NPDC018031]|uniref:Clp protease N-terminal domain-containing protein n=1 Tax=Streptomyces sp. NPDC018031 TaxID=3365033 RepID=UPI0037A7CB15
MQTSPPPAGPDGSGGDGRLSEELVSVIADARRRARRGGDRQIDTAHLLHGLLESDPAVREVFDGGPAGAARLLGYLVQRAIGYGLRWSGRVEDSGALPRVRAGGRAGGPGGPGYGGVAAGWSPAAAAALGRALAGARSRGAACAEGLDLLIAIAGDADCRAVEVIRRAGVDPARLVATAHRPECQQSTG